MEEADLPAGAEPSRASGAEIEITTVADDEVILCVPAVLGEVAVEPALGPDASEEVVPPPEILRPACLSTYGGLAPGRTVVLDGIAVTTLERPGGQRLATIATVNDCHFGEQNCGHLGSVKAAPIMRRPADETPYAQMMNAAVADDIAALAPDALVAKGDLTAAGEEHDFERFLSTYREAVGERLHYIRGNHDAKEGAYVTSPAVAEVVLDGAIIALLDTSIEGVDTGTVSTEQIDWLDELGARADRPIMVMGHHHPASPGSRAAGEYYFGIDPVASAALVEVIARRERIVGYFAGHTHRNRVRYFRSTGSVPYVEVACTKDFPGSWAEYRVFEGGILQVHRRATSPEALAWSEACRVLYGRMYPAYAFGSLEDRCFVIPLRN